MSFSASPFREIFISDQNELFLKCNFVFKPCLFQIIWLTLNLIIEILRPHPIKSKTLFYYPIRERFQSITLKVNMRSIIVYRYFHLFKRNLEESLPYFLRLFLQTYYCRVYLIALSQFFSQSPYLDLQSKYIFYEMVITILKCILQIRKYLPGAIGTIIVSPSRASVSDGPFWISSIFFRTRSLLIAYFI